MRRAIEADIASRTRPTQERARQTVELILDPAVTRKVQLRELFLAIEGYLAVYLDER